MNAGSTFERVYRALKDELLRGAYRPGAQLEPRHLGDQLFASVTPVRDALHRLAGERLVQSSPHDGFRVPLITEEGLRDLYRVQEMLVRLALRGQLVPFDPASICRDNLPIWTRSLLAAVIRTAASPELSLAADQLFDRLSPARTLEPALFADIEEELARLEEALATGDLALFRTLLSRFRASRTRIVPRLVVLLHDPQR